MKGGDRHSKSADEHKKNGTYRKDRHDRRINVSTVNEIDAPSHFKGEHLKKWKEVTSHLRDFGVLTIQDKDSIVTYVESIIMQRKAFDSINEDGFEIDGYPNPALKIYQNLETIIKPLREQFGFTPRSRQGMNVQNKVEEKIDPILEILSKKKAV